MFDPKQMMQSYTSLMKMDEEVDKFYQLLKDKDIEPKSLQDLERIIRFFDATVETVTQSIKEDKAIPDPLKKVVISRFILDMFGKLAETYNLPFEAVPSALGSHNQKKFMECAKAF